MKHVILAAAVLLVVLLPFFSHGGESYLGALVSDAGVDVDNTTTATPFFVPKGAKLTVWCSSASNICVDQTTRCGVGAPDGGAVPGLPVPASTPFPTSVGPPANSNFPTVPSGTGLNGAYVRMASTTSAACYVYGRQGTE